MDERMFGIQPPPAWFNRHGAEMHFFDLRPESKTLIIKGSAAHLMIRPADPGNYGPDRWWLIWEIRFFLRQHAAGEIAVLTEALRRAFGLTDGADESGKWLVDRYGGDSAEQCCYIRQGNHLNIPGPGTGHDGDPNISIFLEDDIKNAVRQLLELP